MRRLVAAGILAGVLAAAPPAAAAPTKATLTPVQGAKFPDRKWVLGLPEERSVAATDLVVTENRRAVRDVQVAPARGSGTFGVILAIDTSPSMRSRDAIGGAMNAARAFAAKRPASHRLGVLFFSGTNRLALAPTTDAARIDETLSVRPPLSEGTRIYDAVGAGFDALEKAGISAGSVVLLSDGCRLRQGECRGADAGSRLDHDGTVALARRFEARVFTVGLRSKSYDPVPLQSLAGETGGVYSEASSPRALATVFDDLGKRLAGEHVVSYRSPSPLGTDVDVVVKIARVGWARGRYRSPALTPLVSVAPTPAPGWWTSSTALVLFALMIASLTGIAVFVLLRPRKLTFVERIGSFTDTTVVERREQAARQSVVLRGAERSLARTKWWPGFVEEVDVAGLNASAVQIVAATVATAAASLWFFAVLLHRPLVGLVLVAGIPWAARSYVRRKANKQRRHFDDQLADNLQVVASAMRAGHSFAGALGVSVEDAAEPAKRELRRVVNDERLGVPVDEALDQAARRMDNRELEHVALVSQLQRDVGGNTAEVLDRLIDTIRANADVRRLVRTLTAQGRLGGTIVSLMPVAVVLIINLLNPDYMDPLFQSTGGKIVLGLGVTAMVSGWLIIRKIVDIKV